MHSRLTPPCFPVRGWIFDCDGTLAASMWIHHRSWTHIISKQLGRPFDFPWPLFCSMGGMSAVDTCKRLKGDYGFDLDVEQLLLADGHAFLEEHLEKDVTARPEVVNIVHHVRGLGHKTAVASAGRKAITCLRRSTGSTSRTSSMPSSQPKTLRAPSRTLTSSSPPPTRIGLIDPSRLRRPRRQPARQGSR